MFDDQVLAVPAGPPTPPAPRHEDQTTIFEVPVETTYGPSGMHFLMDVRMHRQPRTKCSACEKRRVVFWIGVGDALASAKVCARCAGIR